MNSFVRTTPLTVFYDLSHPTEQGETEVLVLLSFQNTDFLRMFVRSPTKNQFLPDDITISEMFLLAPI